MLAFFSVPLFFKVCECNLTHSCFGGISKTHFYFKGMPFVHCSNRKRNPVALHYELYLWEQFKMHTPKVCEWNFFVICRVCLCVWPRGGAAFCFTRLNLEVCPTLSSVFIDIYFAILCKDCDVRKCRIEFWISECAEVKSSNGLHSLTGRPICVLKIIYLTCALSKYYYEDYARYCIIEFEIWISQCTEFNNISMTLF